MMRSILNFAQSQLGVSLKFARSQPELARTWPKLARSQPELCPNFAQSQP